jgi:nanoRNase/pAp phosphatase (c-di-AMP/oligoRNAs hydrolase)
LRNQTRGTAFYDVRTHLGATTTLLYQYWKARGMRVTRRYATVMFYALRSETQDMGREASALDRETYKELYAATDLGALALIGNAKVDRSYFATVARGIEQTKLYGTLLVTELGELPYPDVVAQIAEYFLKLKEASYTAAIGVYRQNVLFSLRGDDPSARLGKVARAIVEGLGTAGGHGSSAGGQVDVQKKDVDHIQRTILGRLLVALGQKGKRGRKLVKIG